MVNLTIALSSPYKTTSLKTKVTKPCPKSASSASTTTSQKTPPPLNQPTPPQKQTSQPQNYHPNKEELKKIFKKYDTNGNGKISLTEYKQALKNLCGARATNKEATQAFKEADIDRDGFVDFDEFCKIMTSDGGVKSSEIKEAFKVFDRDGDGKISAEELMEIMRRSGDKCSLGDCRKMIKAVDRDGDGLIDMDEFMNMMTGKP